MTLFPGWRRERLIHRVLKQLARSRVVGIVQPNNVWIVENALISDSEEIEAALRTCYMRGWIDLLEEKVLHGSPLPDGSLPKPWFQRVGPTWKLTDSRWAAIQRSHQFNLLAICLTVITIILTIFLGQ
jgi:hypothetical protein